MLRHIRKFEDMNFGIILVGASLVYRGLTAEGARHHKIR